MTAHAPAGESRTCDRCGRTVPPRGGLTPRFCAVCGQHLAPVPPATGRGRPDAVGTSPAATAALMLGFCSFVPMCGLPLGLLAVVAGVMASRQIARSGGRLRGDGMATAGITLGIVTTVFWTLLTLRLL